MGIGLHYKKVEEVMAFYLCTHGVWHDHQFSYLIKENFNLRLEKTLVPKKDPAESLKVSESDRHEIIVHELMKKTPLTIEENTPLPAVKKIFKEKGIRHLPVLLDSTKVIGIISDRDLLKVETMGTFQFLKAKDIMNTIIILVDDETAVAHVAKVMIEEKISAMPVINKSHHMVGIITKTDILRGVFDFKLRADS